MSQPTRPRITGLQSVRAASATVAAMPTMEDANSRGRARMIRHTQGARRVFRLSVFIRISNECVRYPGNRSLRQDQGSWRAPAGPTTTPAGCCSSPRMSVARRPAAATAAQTISAPLNPVRKVCCRAAMFSGATAPADVAASARPAEAPPRPAKMAPASATLRLWPTTRPVASRPEASPCLPGGTAFISARVRRLEHALVDAGEDQTPDDLAEGALRVEPRQEEQAQARERQSTRREPARANAIGQRAAHGCHDRDGEGEGRQKQAGFLDGEAAQLFEVEREHEADCEERQHGERHATEG